MNNHRPRVWLQLQRVCGSSGGLCEPLLCTPRTIWVAMGAVGPSKTNLLVQALEQRRKRRLNLYGYWYYRAKDVAVVLPEAIVASIVRRVIECLALYDAKLVLHYHHHRN